MELVIIGVGIFQLALGFGLGLWVAAIRERRRQVVIDQPTFTVDPDSPMGRIDQALTDFGKELTRVLTQQPIMEKAAVMREEAVE